MNVFEVNLFSPLENLWLYRQGRWGYSIRSLAIWVNICVEKERKGGGEINYLQHCYLFCNLMTYIFCKLFTYLSGWCHLQLLSKRILLSDSAKAKNQKPRMESVLKLVMMRNVEIPKRHMYRMSKLSTCTRTLSETISEHLLDFNENTYLKRQYHK